MPRPRTATEILRAKGAFRHDPQRERPAEPKPANELRANPPDYMTASQAAAWRRIVSIAPPGVLMNSDEVMVELAACLLDEFMQAPAEMPTPRIARLERQLGKLGLSPSDRAGLVIQQPDDDDDF